MENQSNILLNCDATQHIKKLQEKTIDCIFTDPPYGLNKKDIKGDESLDLFKSMLPQFYRVLKDGGFFIVFFSTKFLPQLFANNPFNYYWQCILYSPEANVRSRMGQTQYMSCHVFTKGQGFIKNKNRDIFVDTPGKMIEPDEGYIPHPTPKPKTFIKEMLKMFTNDGDIVYDPFAGSASIPLACLQTDRKYIACEIDKKYYDFAVGRLEKFKSQLISIKIV